MDMLKAGIKHVRFSLTGQYIMFKSFSEGILRRMKRVSSITFIFSHQSFEYRTRLIQQNHVFVRKTE